jgi:manganese/iron transport system permease protein
MIDWITEPLQYAFMIRGLLAAVMVGIVCAVSGVYVVLRGMSFLGDALAHSVLPGIAAGYIISGGDRNNLFWWALAAAVLSAFGIHLVSHSKKLKEDTAIGIVFTGMFALGIALISTVRNFAVDLTHFLFGDVLGVSWASLLMTAVFGGSALLIHIFFYREFRIVAFDPILAKTLKLPVRFLDILQLVLLALVIVVSLQTVGIAMMVAMLITPTATAYLLTKRLWKMMILSALLAAGAGISGLYLSYYLSITSGAAIVLTATFLFLVIWLIRNLTGK